MSSQVRLALVALTLFAIAFPLALGKPGLPPNLKADEAAYYLMAVSLARDGDLLVESRDVARAFDEFPFAPLHNLIVMSDDGWRTVYFGKPWLYSLLAVPLVAAFGANGMLLVNVLLMVGMIWLGWGYLRRLNGDAMAALFAVGFFVASAACAYVFWLQPEVLNMAGVTAALYLGLHPSRGRQRGELWRAALSGAALCAPVYNKPVFAALGLAIVWGYLRERRWPALAAWLLGAALTMGALAGVGTLLTGHPSSYLGVVRRGVTVCEPGVVPIGPEEPAGGTTAPGRQAPLSNAWAWLFRIPDVTAREVAENVGYFLWGRHTGLLLYLPFAVVALGYFLAHGRRDSQRWLLLASIVLVALFFVLFVRSNWHGGGGFLGNRYFVTAYPAFLFLVTRITPRPPVLAGYAAGGLLLAPILLTPFGAAVPEPTLQSHVRNFPFHLFPLELSLKHIPGYHRLHADGVTLIGRRDVVLPRGTLDFWVRGGSAVEVLLLSPQPLQAPVFRVEGAAPGDRVELTLDGGDPTAVAGGTTETVVLKAGKPRRRRYLQGAAPLYVHRLRVRTGSGRVRAWDLELPANPCPYFPRGERSADRFFVGAAISLLGSAPRLEEDLYSVAWRRAAVPARVAAGERFTVPVRLVNTSSVAWQAGPGSARVQLSYHWRGADGRVVVRDGLRTPLPLPIAAGAAAGAELTVEAPPEPGRYALEIEPLFEHVAWFSERVPVSVLRREVEVVAP